MKFIKNLDPNEAHGHDMISVCMLKTCGESILKPLELIFTSCIESEKFPIEWKIANVVPVQKKKDKKLNKNYSSDIVAAYLWQVIRTTNL